MNFKLVQSCTSYVEASSPKEAVERLIKLINEGDDDYDIESESIESPECLFEE